MPKTAPICWAVVVLLGCVHGLAGPLHAREFAGPEPAWPTLPREDLTSEGLLQSAPSSPPPRFDAPPTHRDDDDRLDRPRNTPVELPVDALAELPLRSPTAPPVDERLLDISPGDATDWPGPGPLDPPTLLDDLEPEGFTVRERLGWEVGGLWRDFGNYYLRWPTYRNLAIAFVAGAALANTEADERVEDWYERHVRCDATDHASSFFRGFGVGLYVIPGWFGVGLAGALFDERPYGNVAAQFGFQTTRAILVGAPALIFAQYATGGSRPDEASHDSMWRPFRDYNGVSGHTYVGAVPFLTAAGMVEPLWLKALLYVLSVTPGWSRLDDDKHYLSQVILGWCMAYVACDAVAETEATAASAANVALTPVVSDRMVGMGLLVQY